MYRNFNVRPERPLVYSRGPRPLLYTNGLSGLTLKFLYIKLVPLTKGGNRGLCFFWLFYNPLDPPFLRGIFMHHAISACSQALFGNESKRNREGYATSLKFLKP